MFHESFIPPALFSSFEIFGVGRVFITVTLQVAVFPFDVLTVIVAVPVFLAVTLPLLLTVATLVFELLQLYEVVAVDGEIVFVKVYVLPTSNVKEVLLSETEVGETVNETGDVENFIPFAFANC